jgi:hypothetical protein
MRRELRSSNLLFYCLFYFLLCSSSIGRRVSRSRSKGSSSNGRSRAVLRRGLSVLCPFGGLEYCGVGTPSVPTYTNSLAPTSWKDSQPYGEEEQRRQGMRDPNRRERITGPFGVEQVFKPVFLSLCVCSFPRRS